VELGGKSPTFVAVVTVWQRGDGTAVHFSEHALPFIRQFENFNGQMIVPFITWNAQTGFDVRNYAGITTKTIVQSTLDEYIREYARAIKGYGKPVFIRPICAEFHVGGDLFPQCSPRVNPILTPQDFVTAWRRVVDIFRQEGATNVAWVWTPVTLVPPPFDRLINIDPNFESYYPGDDYVDWAGADHYDYGPPTLLDPLYNFAVAHNKPLFLAEWGVRSGFSRLKPTEQEQWLNAMFDYFESRPKIKAVVYSNFNGNFSHPASELPQHVFLYDNRVNYHPDVNDNDYRLLAESGANFRGTFATRIGNPRYISALTAPPTVRLILSGGQFQAGQTLTVGLEVGNPASHPAADLYVGTLLPDGRTLVFLSDSGTLVSVASPAVPALFPRTQAAAAGFVLNAPSFFQFTLPAAGVAPGTYQVFAALVCQGAFEDNRIDPGDILALEIQAFTFVP